MSLQYLLSFLYIFSDITKSISGVFFILQLSSTWVLLPWLNTQFFLAIKNKINKNLYENLPTQKEKYHISENGYLGSFVEAEWFSNIFSQKTTCLICVPKAFMLIILLQIIFIIYVSYIAGTMGCKIESEEGYSCFISGLLFVEYLHFVVVLFLALFLFNSTYFLFHTLFLPSINNFWQSLFLKFTLPNLTFSLFSVLSLKLSNLENEYIVYIVLILKDFSCLLLFYSLNLQLSALIFGNKRTTEIDILNSILSHSSARSFLMNYLFTEYTVENLIFIDYVALFESLSGTEAKLISQYIVKNFIDEQGSLCIALSWSIRQTIKEKFNSGDISKELFTEAKEEIISLIVVDSLPRFMKTEVYSAIYIKDIY
eukprot:snap_masked-scaffold_39-processed-gene-1.27-mRNA-1 protein AED:1.00 eAED:1.00 QI:0/0/0/0/1/1/2/0/369